MINNIKPFYVYEENNSLFIKNINEKIEKIANNIVSYSANFDDKNSIHICAINKKGNLIHFTYNKGKLKKRSICKVCHNINNLKNMRLFIIENYINIFLIEESSLQKNCYRVSHYNFNLANNNVKKYYFNNTLKKDEFIYRLNIDDMDNMIFTYDSFDKKKNSEVNTKTFIFNNSNRKWAQTHNLLRSLSSFSNFYSSSTIKDDIFEYCYSINYENINKKDYQD